ncbi:MAG: Gx transporter family protein [Lachnospiraceae bacterium]|nr:Gx transporter family protein [Lachnospiraceae bacterium]
MEHKTAEKTAYLGLMTTLAVIMGYVESLIPSFFPVPGIKLGLANIVIVFILYRYGSGYALSVSIVRIILTGLLFGNIFGIFFSFSGTLLSIPVMYFLKRSGRFSVIGVCVAGAAFFNVGQIIAAMLVAGPAIFRYLPVLLIAGEAAGIIIGIIVYMVIKRTSRPLTNM